MRFRNSFEHPTGQSRGSISCVSLRKYSWSTNDRNSNECAIKAMIFPQTPSTLGCCLNNDYMEGGNLTIFSKQLFCRDLYALYFHHSCLALMGHQDARYSATPGTLINCWTLLHACEGYGSVIWVCFFSYISPPPSLFPAVHSDWHNDTMCNNTR